MEKLKKPPDPPALQSASVHVWSVGQEIIGGFRQADAFFLNADERDRLARYRFAADRARFGAGRAALRLLLGRYAGVDPAAVDFATTRYGQPMPVPCSPASALSFSVSHSGGRVLLAFSRGIRVGIDVERVREDVDIAGIARRYFAPLEIEGLLSLPDDRRVEAFFAVWTRKEAYLKARGEGLSCPLSSFAVSAGPDEPPQFISLPSGVSPTDWTLRDIDAGSGYRAALAVNHPSPQVSCHNFQSGLPAIR